MKVHGSLNFVCVKRSTYEKPNEDVLIEVSVNNYYTKQLRYPRRIFILPENYELVVVQRATIQPKDDVHCTLERCKKC